MPRPVDSPLATLGLGPGASAEEIRAAYRKLVRRYPPELAPLEFARIHRAYELLRSPGRRLEESLSKPEEALDRLGGGTGLALAPPRPAPPPLTEEALEALVAAQRRARLAELLARFFG